MRFVGDQRELGSAGSAPFQRLSVFEGCVCTGCLSEGCIGAALSCRAQFQRNWASLQANLQGLLANPPLFGKLSTGQFSKFTLCGAHCVWRFRPLRRATKGLCPLDFRKPLKRLDLNFLSLLPSESAYRYLLPTRRVCKGCYLHNRGGRNAADQREQGSAGSAPGAFAKAVISTIEPVDSAYMRFAGDHRELAAEAFRLCASVKPPGSRCAQSLFGNLSYR